MTNNFLKNIFSVYRTLNAKGKNMSDIILFGLSANPPANHHIGIVRSLLEVSSKVIIIPSGTRKQKPSTSTTSPKDRKEMVSLAFGQVPNTEIDFYDLDNETFTPTWLLDKKYKDKFPDSKIWHAIGGDLVAGGKNGESEIQRIWQKGNEIWNQLNWIIIDHPLLPVNSEDLPPNGKIVEISGFSGRSTDVRNRVAAGQPITELVPPEIEKYILKKGLYTCKF
ncbi:MAG: hypothetical protein A3J46_04955 [Candidatus Yanofskybacteria bacterium RIFCSPHIGHO2_02_FULL_41_11]|uniref:nicotinate-nucleotide adenylyltransferase n=1 Tax=Candidatus Yanofskybacteria bacterium RIFCSPHIGHO2_02_FULL_41_11 TaxID=1802675 RepID=A0A1F8FBE0_9BACT|nr:MAG: hypothetical protein A3J46_04955 [Candidatus Yanofskybacteria bacterium RIFCSPHIGHO2_02_FULL_41_11]